MATRKTPRRTKKASDSKKAAAGKRVIAVVGATGAQGGGLVRAILNDKMVRFSLARSLETLTPTRRKQLADRVSSRGRGSRRC